MALDTLAELGRISALERRFNRLYRGAAESFGLPDAAMWVLYFLVFEDGGITQRDVAERMLLPKQTVNSATARLEEGGLVTLERIEGARGKRVTLTAKGEKLAEITVGRMLAAERRAVARMGEEHIGRYIELYGELCDLMADEFVTEGIG